MENGTEGLLKNEKNLVFYLILARKYGGKLDLFRFIFLNWFILQGIYGSSNGKNY